MQRRVPGSSLRVGVIVIMLCGALIAGVGVPLAITWSSPGVLAIEPTATPTSAPTSIVVPSPTTGLAAAATTPAPTVVAQLPLVMKAATVVQAPAFAAQRTTTTRNLSADGYSWAQAWPIQVDQYGHIFTLAQAQRGAHHFVYSNDGGQSWDDSVLVMPGFRRGTMAYDPRLDLVHVLWVGQAPEVGVVYRRYGIERDAQGRIAGFRTDESLAVTLDRQTDGQLVYEYPLLLWLDDAEFGAYGAVLAIWSVRNDAAGRQGSEIRAAMRVLDGSSADAQASGWQAPITADNTTIGNRAQVAVSTLLATKNTGAIGVSALRKAAGTHRKDVYLFFGDQAGWRFRRAGWDQAALRWSSLSQPTLLSAMTRAGTNYGYSNKLELGSKPAEDPINDRVYFGFATWRNDQVGDTWSFVFVDGADASSPIVDVYSAGGPHSFAPTGDIVVDPQTGRLVVSYIQTGAGKEYAYIKAYEGTAEVQPATLVFDAAPVDIPLLWQGGRYRSATGDKLLMLFRDAIDTPNPPYDGYFGTLDWVAN